MQTAGIERTKKEEKKEGPTGVSGLILGLLEEDPFTQTFEDLSSAWIEPEHCSKVMRVAVLFGAREAGVRHLPLIRSGVHSP